MKPDLLSYLEKLSNMTKLGPAGKAWIRDFTVYNYYIILTVLFIMLIAAIFTNRRALMEMAGRCKKKNLLIIGGIAFLSLLYKLLLLDLHPQVYFDEVLFIQTAISYSKDGVHLLWGVLDYPRNFMVCTAGWPYLIALAIRLTGIDKPETAYVLSALMSSATVFWVFFTVNLLFDNEEAGLWSGALFAVYPVFNRLSTSSAMGTSSVFFIFFTLMLMALYFRERKTPLLYLVFISFAYTLNIRQESFMTILPTLLAFFLIFHPDIKSEFKKPHIYINLAILGAFVFPAAAISFYGISTGYYYFFESPELMREHIHRNLHYNLAYWIENKIQPLSVTVLSVLGLYVLGRGWKKMALFFAGWLVFMQFFYSINPSCEFSCVRTLDSWRSAVNLLIPVIITAGLGITLIAEYFRRHFPSRFPWASGLMLIVILMIPVKFYNFETDKTVWAKEYIFLRENTASLAPSSVVIVDRGEKRSFDSFMSCSAYASRVPLISFQNMDPGQLYSQRQFVRYAHRMMKYEKRPVYLYLSMVNSINFKERMLFYRRIFRLSPIAGYSLNDFHLGFILYRIDGFDEEGEQLRSRLDPQDPSAEGSSRN